MKLKEAINVNAMDKNFDKTFLLDVRKNLVRNTNNRLRALDKTVSQVTGETYGSYGAADLIKDYIQEKRKTSKRMSEKTPDSIGAIKKDIAVMQKFLKSKSSTVKGQKEIEEKRLQTFASGNWGAAKYTGKVNRELKHAKNKSFYDFLKSDTFKRLKAIFYDSNQIVEAYDMARENYNYKKTEKIFAQAVEEYESKEVKASLKDLRRRVLK